ncbi:hypothetical protein OIU77_028180 [Salix suchowensis]|uniref:Uncharacterized protein n=1 Tax=Salix suchowensis TaxID=1278906 RepID=A0ABQ9BIR3_9ROSI|nr:hypothetical protein OIU77_028180 [Salix suchowensis]
MNPTSGSDFTEQAATVSSPPVSENSFLSLPFLFLPELNDSLLSWVTESPTSHDSSPPPPPPSAAVFLFDPLVTGSGSPEPLRAGSSFSISPAASSTPPFPPDPVEFDSFTDRFSRSDSSPETETGFPDSCSFSVSDLSSFRSGFSVLLSPP